MVFLLLRERFFFLRWLVASSTFSLLLSLAAPARGALAPLQDLLDLGKLPLLVAQRARGAGLEPADVFFFRLRVFLFCFFLRGQKERVSFSDFEREFVFSFSL